MKTMKCCPSSHIHEGSGHRNVVSIPVSKNKGKCHAIKFVMSQMRFTDANFKNIISVAATRHLKDHKQA